MKLNSVLIFGVTSVTLIAETELGFDFPTKD